MVIELFVIFKAGSAITGSLPFVPQLMLLCQDHNVYQFAVLFVFFKRKIIFTFLESN